MTRLIVQIDANTSLEVWGSWDSRDLSHVAVKLVRRGLPDHQLKVTDAVACEVGHYLIGLRESRGDTT